MEDNARKFIVNKVDSEFLDGKLCMLEVDALSEAERDGLEMKDFPYTLTEVTGDMRYYGYRMPDMLK